MNKLVNADPMDKILAAQTLIMHPHNSMERYYIKQEEVSPDLNEAIMNIFDNKYDGQVIEADKNYEISFSLTSAEIQEGWVINPGSINPDFVSQYDLFGKKNTTLQTVVCNAAVISVVVKHLSY